MVFNKLIFLDNTDTIAKLKTDCLSTDYIRLSNNANDRIGYTANSQGYGIYRDSNEAILFLMCIKPKDSSSGSVDNYGYCAISYFPTLACTSAGPGTSLNYVDKFRNPIQYTTSNGVTLYIYDKEELSAVPSSGGNITITCDSNTKDLSPRTTVRTRPYHICEGTSFYGTASELREISNILDRYGDIMSRGNTGIVPWATGTDAQISVMIDKLDSGLIRFADTGWSVGDTRTVQLSATAADSARGIEAHAAQTAELVIMDTTCTGFTINGNTPHAIVGLKDGLIETGQMNSTATNIGGWKDCKCRSWCNTEFKASLPTTVRSWFKQFEWKTSNGGSSTSLNTVLDYFALAPEKCIFGFKHYAHEEESDLYARWPYYIEQSNRIKKNGSSGSDGGWWYCSPRSGTEHQFGMVSYMGGEYYFVATYSLLLSPFGCI